MSDNDKKTIVTLTSSTTRLCLFEQLHAMMIKPTRTVTDTGATSVFVLEGTPCKNKKLAENPITILLPDGTMVMLRHICNITIPSLPFTLVRHIVPEMKMVFLLGIRVLCKTGCTVIFDDKKCQIIFNNKVILTGYKDPLNNLWTLPICHEEHRTSPGSVKLTRPQPGHCKNCTPMSPMIAQHTAGFSYHHTTKENDVKFMHQSLCNPPIFF